MGLGRSSRRGRNALPVAAPAFGRPAHAIVGVPGTRHPGSPPEDPLGGGRLEFGYIAIGHRTAFVQQSAAAFPEHLEEGFRRALASPRPALHVLTAECFAAEDDVEAEARARAALESRAHPFFRYDPDAGATWAGRMDFGQP
jgi:hypothetical protein